MPKEVGYLLNYSDRLEGERGTFFNYIMAANGIFIEASNPVLSARVPAAILEIRGLAPIKPKIVLTYGSIPQCFFDLALDTFLSAPEKESYVGVIADRGYHFYVPEQDKQDAKVTYNVGDSVILDIHSHGKIRACFSGQDDQDETGLKLYGVVGSLDKTPVVYLRVGVYGYFWPLSYKEVFDGTLYGAKEFEEGDVQERPIQTEELVQDEHDSSRVWWHRWFR
jgi:PRTRC genetic system protein A